MHPSLKSLLPTSIQHRLAAAAPRAAASPAALPVPVANAACADGAAPEALRGCGWFDSSHELHQGLCVTEHSQPDTVANELGVRAWMDLHLAGWTAPGAVSLRH